MRVAWAFVAVSNSQSHTRCSGAKHSTKPKYVREKNVDPHEIQAARDQSISSLESNVCVCVCVLQT